MIKKKGQSFQQIKFSQINKISYKSTSKCVMDLNVSWKT